MPADRHEARATRRSPFARAAAAAALGCLWATGAMAEPVQENAVTAAEDAFGLAVGNQAIGLYSMSEARGFNPQQAGNLRLEGLYFDSPSAYLPPCLMRATVMRIGITAQSYSFPAPTGIADLKLHVPGDQAGVGGYLSRGPYADAALRVEAEAPLGEHLAGSACGSIDSNFAPDQARESTNTSVGAVLRWHPFEQLEVLPFAAMQNGGQYRMVPMVFSDGAQPPPEFDVRDLAALPGTSYGWRNVVVGAIARLRLGAEWSLDAGAFRATEQDRRSDIDEYLLGAPGAPVGHLVDALPPLSSASTSGELRLVRRFGSGAHQRKLDLSVRARRSERAYGGDTLWCYPDTPLTGPAASGPPASCGLPGLPASLDETRQVDAGIVYEERWTGVGSVGVGLLRSHYTRAIRSDETTQPATLATPWLASVRFTAEPRAGLTLYGSFLQGLEDSALAPYSATNRGEPPPATRSRQADAGLRYAPGQHLSLVAGVFDIQKAYFNLDAGGLYTALGSVRHRGVEASLVYGNGGLTVLAGAVRLRPHVERFAAEPWATGSEPVGPVPLEATLNFDYAPPRWKPLAASLAINHESARTATLDNRYTLPSLTVVNAGLRLETTMRGRPLTVRLDGANLLNRQGVHLSPVGQVLPEFGRRVMLSLSVDR
ncbi:MAG: TonB-dependent receptor [Proteobacteria bacterium]|nr:TonB-dependent receptor [Pseudomonadota bacterium]